MPLQPRAALHELVGTDTGGDDGVVATRPRKSRLNDKLPAPTTNHGSVQRRPGLSFAFDFCGLRSRAAAFGDTPRTS